MSQHKATYQQHIEELQARTREALQREGLDGLVIHSGPVSYTHLTLPTNSEV